MQGNLAFYKASSNVDFVKYDTELLINEYWHV